MPDRLTDGADFIGPFPTLGGAGPKTGRLECHTFVTGCVVVVEKMFQKRSGFLLQGFKDCRKVFVIIHHNEANPPFITHVVQQQASVCVSLLRIVGKRRK